MKLGPRALRRHLHNHHNHHQPPPPPPPDSSLEPPPPPPPPPAATSSRPLSSSSSTSSSASSPDPASSHSPSPAARPPPPAAPRRRNTFFGLTLRRAASKPKLKPIDVRSVSTASSTPGRAATDHNPPPPPDAPAAPASQVPSLNLQEASPVKERRRVVPADLPVTFSPPSLSRPTTSTSPLSRPDLPKSPLRLEYLDTHPARTGAASESYFPPFHAASRPAPMTARRRVWVRRPGASPTLVQYQEDDLVDDVRDTLLRKYQNSLGRCFDSPEVSLKLIPREASHRERILSPEESMSKTLEVFYPGGQTIEEALVIDVPVKRTPRASPGLGNHHVSYVDYHRPAESGNDYFPPMPAPSPGGHVSNGEARPFHPPHSISILETGQAPPLPSPGASARKAHRPKSNRAHTGSPTIINGTNNPAASRPHKTRRDSDHQRPPNPPPLPTPPANDMTSSALANKVATPPPLERVASPRPKRRKPKPIGENNNANGQIRSLYPTLPPGLLDNSVPPINVLIVEDNIINLKLLEQLARKLKIRWQTAMNGKEAVQKWRTGGFHLVLMDIQLPIMSGLEATKEIRRLERVNGIAVFARSEAEERAPQLSADAMEATSEDDRIEGIFKSPVIIVALTASSLQSDRHEALAAGCNDFLTKPVNTVWFERKVMEWGCMQALIDFDGWRQWKDRAAQEEREKAEKEKNMTEEQRLKKEKKEKKRAEALAKMGMAQT